MTDHALPHRLDADTVLARLGDLTLQPTDWLRLLTLARVTAITAGLEPGVTNGAACMTSLLDDSFVDELFLNIRDAGGALPRLRALHLTSAGWVRVLMTAHLMAAIGAQEAMRQ